MGNTNIQFLIWSVITDDEITTQIAQEIQAKLVANSRKGKEVEISTYNPPIDNLSGFSRLRQEHPNDLIMIIVPHGDQEADRLRNSYSILREDKVIVYPYSNSLELEQYIAMWDKHC